MSSLRTSRRNEEPSKWKPDIQRKKGGKKAKKRTKKKEKKKTKRKKEERKETGETWKEKNRRHKKGNESMN